MELPVWGTLCIRVEREAAIADCCGNVSVIGTEFRLIIWSGLPLAWEGGEVGTGLVEYVRTTKGERRET